MVASNPNHDLRAHPLRAWDRATTALYLWVNSYISQPLGVFTRYLSRTPGSQHHDGIIRYISMPARQPDYLLERSDLLFRRDNQGESFDDDVSALRDQVGAGRRDEPGESQYSDAEQTTYSPPRQSWNATSTSTESTYQAPTAETPSRTDLDAANASVIAADSSWDGTVQSGGAVHVYGKLSGHVTAVGDVFIADGAHVTAEVRAGSVTVAGVIEGTIECTGRFEVLPTGRVTADVAAPRLVVHEGAIVVGKLRMTADQAQGE